MRFPIIGVAALGLGVVACSDLTSVSRLTPRGPGYYSASEPGVTFDVTGFTYGPDGQEVTPAKCASEQTLTSDSLVFPYPVEQGGRYVYTWSKFGSQCGINSTLGGDAYMGGTISITGYSDTQSLGFGSTDARWDRIRTIANFPSSATVVLTPWPNATSSCLSPTFVSWVIDNNWGNQRYENPLVISAVDIANHQVMGQFQCSKPPSGGGTGDLPPGYYYCDDPSSDPYCVQGDD